MLVKINEHNGPVLVETTSITHVYYDNEALHLTFVGDRRETFVVPEGGAAAFQRFQLQLAGIVEVVDGDGKYHVIRVDTILRTVTDQQEQVIYLHLMSEDFIVVPLSNRNAGAIGIFFDPVGL